MADFPNCSEIALLLMLLMDLRFLKYFHTRVTEYYHVGLMCRANHHFMSYHHGNLYPLLRSVLVKTTCHTVCQDTPFSGNLIIPADLCFGLSRFVFFPKIVGM